MRLSLWVSRLTPAAFYLGLALDRRFKAPRLAAPVFIPSRRTCPKYTGWGYTLATPIPMPFVSRVVPSNETCEPT
jgi:hypothetical protein